MSAAMGARECKTRATHFKGRFGTAMGGHLYLRPGTVPALIFRAHPFFQRRYELQMQVIDIKSVTGSTRLAVELSDGRVESFLIAGGTDLLPALERSRKAARRVGSGNGRRDEDGPHYWATGNYDPDRYYQATSGWSREYREYVRDAYGDLDTYEANRPD